MKDPNKIGFREKLSYAVVNYGDELQSGFVGMFLLYFFTNILHISPGIAGTISGAAVLWDAINDPVIANRADNHRFRNGDHLRPLLWASIPKVIIAVLLFTRFSENPTTSALIALMLYFLYSVASTYYYLPIYSLIQLATPEPKERITLNSFLSAGSTVGAISSELLMWPLVRWISGLDEDRRMIDPERGFFWGAVIVGAVLIAGVAFNFFSTRERFRDEVDQNKKTNILEGAKTLLKERNFVVNILVTFCYSLALYPTTTYLVYYCSYVLKNEDALTLVAACYMLGTLVILPFVNKFYKRFGRKHTLFGAGIVMGLANLFLLVSPASIPVNLVRAAVFGLASSPIIVITSLNRGDVTDLIDLKTGVRLDGMVNNVQTFMRKAAMAAVTTVMGWAMTWSGYDADLVEQPHSVVMFFIISCSFGAGFAAFLLAMLSRRYTLDEELTELRKEGVSE